MCPISQLLSLVECFRLHVNKVCEHWRFRIYSSLRLSYNNSYWIHCNMEDVAVMSKVHFSSSFCRIVAWVLTVKLRSGECNRTLLLSQHWFIIGSCNGLVQPGNKPLPEPMFTQIYVAIWRHRATIIKSPQPGFQSLWFICIWLVRIFIWTWVIMVYKYFTCFVGIKTCQEFTCRSCSDHQMGLSQVNAIEMMVEWVKITLLSFWKLLNSHNSAWLMMCCNNRAHPKSQVWDLAKYHTKA